MQPLTICVTWNDTHTHTERRVVISPLGPHATKCFLGLQIRLSLHTAGPQGGAKKLFFSRTESLRFVWKEELGWEGLFPTANHFLCLEAGGNSGGRRLEAFSDPPSRGGLWWGMGRRKQSFCQLLAFNFSPLQNS